MALSTRRGVQPLGDILSELVARRGLARTRGQEHLEQAWSNAAGQTAARYSRVGGLRRGVLEVLVANSVLLQELAGFQKETLLEKLQTELDSREVRALRFRLDDGA